MNEIQGILLAAGTGQRFGGHKLLYPLPNGELVGMAAAHNLVTALPNTLAIVRPDDVRLAEHFEALGLSVLENALVEQGMGRSLAIGIGASA
ncbi:MAG: NTP transferase domain-containing protein, partial [Candidatus Thiodiazotropha endolucinida]